MIKVSELEKYGIELVKGDAVEFYDGEKVDVNLLIDIQVLINMQSVVTEFAWRGCTEHTTTYVCEYKMSDSGLKLYRPNMQWLIDQESKTQQEESKMKNLLTPDQELALAEMKSDLSNMQKYIDCIYNSDGIISDPEHPKVRDVTQFVDIHKTLSSTIAKPIFTQEMADAGELPSVGFKFKLYFDCDDHVFGYLQSELYGWECYDNLEVLKVVEDESGDKVAIVLNSETNVLTTAAIRNYELFIKPKTELEKAIESIIDVLSKYETDVTELVKNRDTFKGVAQAIFDAGYRKVK